MEVDSEDIIRIIEQYLKENKLTKSLNVLQDESGISLNSVYDINIFVENIENGKWDKVLELIQDLRIPDENLIDLYEQIIFELMELREKLTAKTILLQSKPMELLKFSNKDRFKKLELLINKSFFDPKDFYSSNHSKEKRRKAIAQQLKTEINVTQPSRLITLITQSLKWQQYKGMLPPCNKLDLFMNKPINNNKSIESYPTQLYQEINFLKGSHAQVILFSPDGQYLVSGSSDGFIEVWNFETGLLRNDLIYQKQENFMLMNDAITSLNFSADSDKLISASKEGDVTIWDIETGRQLKIFEKAHNTAINVAIFNRDHTHIVTGSCDNLIRIHGLKSSKCIRELQGHTSFINDIIINKEQTKLISCSSDHTIRIWSYKSGECLKTINSPSGDAINCISWFSEDKIIVCGKTLLVMNLEGQVLHSFKLMEAVEFLHGRISPRGKFYYAIDSQHRLYSFYIEDVTKEDCIEFVSFHQNTLQIHEKDVFSISIHPIQNYIASASLDGVVKIWSS